MYAFGKCLFTIWLANGRVLSSLTHSPLPSISLTLICFFLCSLQKVSIIRSCFKRYILLRYKFISHRRAPLQVTAAHSCMSITFKGEVGFKRSRQMRGTCITFEQNLIKNDQPNTNWHLGDGSCEDPFLLLCTKK